MKTKGFFRRSLGPSADIEKGVDYGFLRQNWWSIRKILSSLFRPQQASQIETFEEAQQRLNLDENAIQKRIKEFKRLLFIFVAMAVFTFIYTVYLGAMGDTKNALLGLVISLLILTRVFHFHFWLFQIKNRKLGCSLKEWLNSTIIGGLQ